MLGVPTLGARDFSTAEDVSAFGQHRKFPPHARKTSGTQGREFPDGAQSFLYCSRSNCDGINQYLMELNGYEGRQTPLLYVSVDLKVHNVQ